MFLRVTDNSINAKFTKNLQHTLRRHTEASMRSNDGQRIRSASDDPTAIARTVKNISAKRALTGYKDNNSIALRVNQSSHAMLDQFQNNVSARAQNIAAESGSLIDSEAMLLKATELDALLEEALNLINSKLTGTQDYLFGGDRTDAEPFSVIRDVNNKITSVTYGGATTAKSFYIGDGVELSPQLSPNDSAKLAGYMNTLVSLRDTLVNGDSDAIPTVQQNIIADHSDMLSSLTGLGATQKRLVLAAEMDSGRFHSIERQVSQDVDGDLPTLMTEFKNSEYALHKAVQIGNTILNQPIMNPV